MNCSFLRYHFLLCLFLFGANSASFAQEVKRTSEEEVSTQKVFIEANREKILGNYENAAYLYQEVIKRDAKNHAAFYELARIYDVLDKDSEALTAIQQAIKYDDSNMWYRMFLGDVYEKKGAYKDAAKVYEDLSKDDPNLDIYFHKWAYYLVKAKDPSRAIKVYDDLEKRIGISEEVSQKKHRLYLGQGNSKKAAIELNNLIKAYPSQVSYRYALASFYEQTTQLDLAKKEYSKILEIDPNDTRAKIALASSSKGGSKDVAYLQSLKPIFEKGDLDIDYKIKELMPYISKVVENNDTELANTALELTDILARVHPNEAKSFSAYGDLLYHTGQKEEALSKFQKAIELDDSVFPIWEQVMYIALEINDNSLLDKYSMDAIDLFPNQAMAYYFQGIAQSNKKAYKKAISEYQQALMMSRKKPFLQFDLFHRLAKAYFQTKAFDKSFKSFEDALALNPKEPNLLSDYSFHLAFVDKNLDKAKDMAALANELVPNQAVFQDTYGFVLFKRKEYSESKTWLNKALASDGEKSPAILEHYGDLLFATNDKVNAVRYWKKALDRGSESKDLQKKIQESGVEEQ